MRKAIVGIMVSSALSACSADPGEDTVSESQNRPVAAEEDQPLAPPAQPFYQFEVGGHQVQFVEPSPGALVVVEISPTGEESVMNGVDPTGGTLAAVYQTLVPDSDVPEVVLAYDQNQAEAADPALDEAAGTSTESGTPELAATAPNLSLKHEAGPAHFASVHCPTAPDPATWFSFYEEHSPITTRSFCWSGGYTGAWTEKSYSKVMTQEVAAVSGTVCYNLGIYEGGSYSWTIVQGTTARYWARNHTERDNSCCVICACGSQDIAMHTITTSISTGAPGCSAPGLVWRWGGGFWK